MTGQFYQCFITLYMVHDPTSALAVLQSYPRYLPAQFSKPPTLHLSLFSAFLPCCVMPSQIQGPPAVLQSGPATLLSLSVHCFSELLLHLLCWTKAQQPIVFLCSHKPGINYIRNGLKKHTVKLQINCAAAFLMSRQAQCHKMHCKNDPTFQVHIQTFQFCRSHSTPSQKRTVCWMLSATPLKIQKCIPSISDGSNSKATTQPWSFVSHPAMESTLTHWQLNVFPSWVWTLGTKQLPELQLLYTAAPL